MKDNNSNGNVLVIIKAFELLDIINKEGSIGLSELARKSGFKKPTVARMLNTLKNLGIIDQDELNKQYFLTMHLVNMANLILEKVDVRKLSRPLIENFVLDHNKSVLLAYYQHPNIVYIDKILSSEPFTIRTIIGSNVIVHCTATGKAILAHLNEDEIKSIIGNKKLQAFTTYTLTTLSDLMQDFAIIRQRGFAIDDRERSMELVSVSAPIFDHNNKVIAAVSIPSFANNIDKSGIMELGNKLVQLGKNISIRLGWTDNVINS